MPFWILLLPPGLGYCQPPPKERVPLTRLYRKTFFLSTGVFITFAIAMFFPVFTVRIPSVSPAPQPPLLQPTAFIPLSFLLWNTGDLTGRLFAAFPLLRITSKPRLILLLACLRVVFIPAYYLFNVDGNGGVVPSDVAYWVFQVLYGLTNGLLGTNCMMGAVEYVDVDEREATGAFMTLMLVGGLSVGSLLSFSVR